MTERPDILVVEDEPDMADAMLRVLDIGGYAPRRAGDGLQALRAVALRRPALVLLDILMPVMDGWQCARELRVRYGNSLPIVVVTAAEHAKARASAVGADDFLAKPFEMGALLDVVARHTAKGTADVG